MSYLDAYHAWLNSPALSAAEKAELASIQGDDKEIESRFFDQLSFGTAGLRGLSHRAGPHRPPHWDFPSRRSAPAP